jgi:hypothetical protein
MLQQQRRHHHHHFQLLQLRQTQRLRLRLLKHLLQRLRRQTQRLRLRLLKHLLQRLRRQLPVPLLLQQHFLQLQLLLLMQLNQQL